MVTSIELWVLAIVLALIAIIGVAGNIIMICVFFTYKKLRSPCHYLIMMCCLADCLHTSSQFIFTFHLALDLRTPQFHCFLTLLPALFGVVSGVMWMLSLGIDRLIACRWPFRYRSLVAGPFYYIFAQCIFPALPIFLFLYTAYLETSKSQKNVICAVPTAMGERAFSRFATFNLAVIFVVIVLYTFVFVIIYRKEGPIRRTLKNVFKPILVTVLLVVAGWMITAVANCVASFLEDKYIMMLINFYAGIPVNMACASNIFVFYSINPDYRTGVKRLFGRGKQTTKVTASPIPLEQISTVTVAPQA